MKISDYNTEFYLKGRLIQERKNKSLPQEELNYLKDIFDSSEYLSSNFPDVIFSSRNFEMIDANIESDVYKYKHGKKFYLIKISENSNQVSPFDREIKALQNRNLWKIAPRFLYQETQQQQENIDFIITTFEAGYPVNEIGISGLQKQIRTFANTVSYLHEYTSHESSEETKEFFEYISDLVDFKEILPEETYESFIQIPILSKVEDIISKIRNDAEKEIEKLSVDDISLCHLNYSNKKVLFRDGLFKFVNFEKSFYVDPIWDILFALFAFKFNLDEDYKNIFVNQYFKSHQSTFLTAKEANKKIRSYEKTVAKVFLLKIIASNFYERVLFDTERPTKYLQLARFYESIRSIIGREYEDYIDTLDKMFYIYSE